MTKHITIKEAREALKYLKTLVPANPKLADDVEMSIKEAVAFMAPDLAQLSKRGFTHKELAAGLIERGISIKAGTLNRYLSEYLAANNSPAESEVAMKAGHSKDEKPEKKVRPGPAKNPKPDAETAGAKSDLPANQMFTPSITPDQE